MESITIANLAKAVDGIILAGSAYESINKVLIDSRQDCLGGVFFAIKGENTDGHLYLDQALKNNAKALVVHNDINTQHINAAVIKVKDTQQALLDFAGYYKSLFNIPVVAVTGSSGKTTTKDIIASVLSQKYNTLKTIGNFNNQTGMPQTIFNIEKSHEMAVIEFGMSSPGEIYNLAKSIKPDIAVITNIGYSHIQHLKTRENIFKAKTEIVSFFNKNNIAIVNADDDYLKSLSSDKYKIYKAGINNGDIRAENIVQSRGGMDFEVQKEKYFFPLIGMHNVYNCLYAVIIAKHYGLTRAHIQKGFDNFTPSSNRMDIKDINGITVINDVYNSNPQAAQAALAVLKNIDKKGRKIAVLADMLELGQYSKNLHEQIGEYAAECNTDILVTIGKESQYTSNAAISAGLSNSHHFTDNYTAAKYLKSIIIPGDVVLFKGSRGMKLEQLINTLFSEEKQ